MKRITAVLTIIGMALSVWAAFQGAASPEPSLARLMPEGAVLFVEARDFSALLRDWSASPEKQAWLKSANYETFSRSRLLLRLKQMQEEFASAAGIPPSMNFLNDVAGEHSALALYDIGKLELVYVTRLPSARSMQSALWQQRAQFEPRQTAGRSFFVRTEPQSGRVVAFAVEGDYLILGTREDLVGGVLSILAGEKVAPLSDEGWYAEIVKTAKAPGDLRMVIDLAEVTQTPQFRTYWIQQNITAMRQYKSALSDLYRSATEYREERVLLAAGESNTASTPSADDARTAADLLRLVPPEQGFYRVVAAPSVDEALALLEEKVLTPRLGPAPPQKLAPAVSLGGGTVGSESSLETRIDTPPPAITTETRADDALKAVLTSGKIGAALALHRSEGAADGVFVRLLSTVILSGSADWNEEAARSAVQRLMAPALTTTQLGATWKPAQGYAELDGLAPIMLAIRNHYLILSNDAPTMAAVLGRMRSPGEADAVVYAAGLEHARERQSFNRFTALVDRPSRNNNAEMGGNEPQFFSENIASLSQVFGAVKSQSIVVRRNGGVETQTVRYVWSR